MNLAAGSKKDPPPPYLNRRVERRAFLAHRLSREQERRLVAVQSQKDKRRDQIRRDRIKLKLDKLEVEERGFASIIYLPPSTTPICVFCGRGPNSPYCGTGHPFFYGNVTVSNAGNF